jgi:putative ABC transport system permease protein
MNIFSKVTLQSLKKNRTRTIVTIIGIILSTALICAVTTSVASVQRYALNYFEYTEGKWHGCENKSDIGVYNKIRSSDKIEGAGCLSYIGYANIESKNKYKPYLYVCGFEENMDGLIPVHLQSGRMPENRNEIIIPEHLNDNGGVNVKEGDKLTLEVGDRKIDPGQMVETGIESEQYIEEYGESYDSMILTQQNPMMAVDAADDVLTAEYLDVRETREFTVVGTYSRPDFEVYSAPGYTALTVYEDSDELTEAEVYYRMKNARDIYDFKKDNGLNGTTHSELLLLTGVSRYESFYSLISGLILIIVGLIMFGSIMLIYNAFSISVSERTKQFGLLSSIGATKKQLKKMVRFEAFVLSIIGIPLGIIVGIVGMWVTFLAIGSKFTAFSDNRYSEPLRICVSSAAIIAAAIIAFVTITISAWIPSKRATKISAVEAIRQNSDITQKKYIKTPKFIAKIFGLPGMLAHKYFKRSKKKYRATVISLFMSIVLFISAYSFTAYLVSAVSDTHDTMGMDYTYSMYNTSKITEISAEKINDIIKNTDFITDSTFIEYDNIPVSIDSKYINDSALKDGFVFDRSESMPSENGKNYKNMDIFFVDDESFRKFAKDCNVDPDAFFDKSTLNGIALDNTLYFDGESEKMKRLKMFKASEFDIGTRVYDKMDGYYFNELDEDGNAVYVDKNAFEVTEDNSIKVPAEDCSKDISIHISKVIDERPFFVYSDTQCIVFPLNSFKLLYGDKQENNVNHFEFCIKSDDVYEGYDALKNSLKENGLSTDGLYNYADEAESNRNMIIIIKVFAYGFIILISLIAAANVFNTITTNISLRRREFAMLRSVGMGSKSMRKMLNFECILYGTKALLYGLPVSAVVTYLIYRAVNEGVDTEFFIPWTAVIVAVLSVFIVVFSTMMFSMIKIRKDNTIDALKNENL